MTTEINGVKLKKNYLVLPKQSCPIDVILGKDLFQEHSFICIVDHNGPQLLKDFSGFLTENITGVSSHQGEIDKLPENESRQLKLLLENFKTMFTTGNKVDAIKGTLLEIQLREPHIVSRSPCRMSHQEKIILNDILQDLLKNNIIRVRVR